MQMVQRHAIEARQKMPTIDDIGAHRERLADRLARIDAQRLKLVKELAELETAERVLSRFTSTSTARHSRRRRPRTIAADDTSAQSSGQQRKTRRTQRERSRKQVMPLREASLQAVEALRTEASAEQIRSYMSREFGLRLLPLHLGRALQSHRRAGRVEEYNGRWSMPQGHSAERKAAE